MREHGVPFHVITVLGEASLDRADDLPPNVRVIKPTDTINDQTRNPNRLTIFLGDDGKIEDAYWN